MAEDLTKADANAAGAATAPKEADAKATDAKAEDQKGVADKPADAKAGAKAGNEKGAEDHASRKEAAEEKGDAWRQVVTSIVLIVFTFGVGLLCVLLLYCTLMQGRMSNISVNGVNLNIWKLADIQQQWSDLRNTIQKQSAKLAEAKETAGATATAKSIFDIKWSAALTPLDADFKALRSHLQQFDDTIGIAKELDPEDHGPVERLATLESSKGRLSEEHKELQPEIEKIMQQADNYRAIDTERIKIWGDAKSSKALAEVQENSFQSLVASLSGLFSSQFNNKPIDDTTRERMENALFELYPKGSYMNYLILAPSDILTLLLVISMGVLGSALQMTHALFQNNQVENPGVYFLRVSVGAITALVIFIVAKAGVPVIADASRLGGDAPINPYFVSFLAIISGLMSEKAILSVQTQGARLFASDAAAEQQRWARVDLRSGFKDGSLDNLKRLLNTLQPTEIDQWISGEKPIPGTAQTMIAAALGKAPRDLFTDLEPTTVIGSASASHPAEVPQTNATESPKPDKN
jgi:DNA-binding transcriptional regulator YdaS (Cro superfamily)